MRNLVSSAVVLAIATVHPGICAAAEPDTLIVRTTFGADADGIVKISGDALACKDSRDVGPLDRRKRGWNGLDDGNRIGSAGMK